MKRRHILPGLLGSLAVLLPLLDVACGEPPPQTPAAPTPKMVPPPPPPQTAPVPVATGPKKPGAAEARAFLARTDAELRRLWVARDRAGWVNQNFITDDTESLSAAGEEATAEFVTRAIHEAHGFEGVELSPAELRLYMAKNRSFTSPFFWPSHKVTATASDMVHAVAPYMKDPLHGVKKVGRRILGLFSRSATASH